MRNNENRLSEEVNPKVESKYKWLFLVRVALISYLLSITVYAHLNKGDQETGGPLLVIYCVVVALFCYTLIHFLRVRKENQRLLPAYVQFAVDTSVVSLIVFTTGGYYSFFSFLYLVVIIFSSMVLYFRGGMIVAALCSLQYALLIFFEYSAVLIPIANNDGLLGYHQSTWNVFSKVLITSIACFAVAVLSGLLTEQNRKSQRELKNMENHVRRVEKMAYMGELAAGLAHEIKNPLASLVGSIQMLKDELPYSSDHQYLMGIILRETDRLSSLVTDFLFFARPPAGKPEKINLKRAVEEICALFEKDTSHAGKLLLQEHVEDHVWVLMDPVHFRQVLWNLILNAAESIIDTGVVTIGTREVRDQEIEVFVEDTGCGIPPDKLSVIFDPFYTTKQQGSGLGLSIVHRILESYGSRLDVETKEGEGTIFSFLLKLVNPP